jgi:tRNA U54 and U55 pseudouridine synthase Pus10
MQIQWQQPRALARVHLLFWRWGSRSRMLAAMAALRRSALGAGRALLNFEEFDGQMFGVGIEVVVEVKMGQSRRPAVAQIR